MPSSARAEAASPSVETSESNSVRMNASVCSRVTCYDRREVLRKNRRRRRRSSAYYDGQGAAPAAITVALTQLLYRDGRTMPDSPDRAALLAYVDLLRSNSRGDAARNDG